MAKKKGAPKHAEAQAGADQPVTSYRAMGGALTLEEASPPCTDNLFKKTSCKHGLWPVCVCQQGPIPCPAALLRPTHMKEKVT